MIEKLRDRFKLWQNGLDGPKNLELAKTIVTFTPEEAGRVKVFGSVASEYAHLNFGFARYRMNERVAEYLLTYPVIYDTVTEPMIQLLRTSGDSGNVVHTACVHWLKYLGFPDSQIGLHALNMALLVNDVRSRLSK